MSDLKYAAFDPGGSTGIAGWDNPREAPVVFGKEADFPGVVEFLRTLQAQENLPLVIVLEEYRIFNDKFNHQGSKVLTIQVIGAIKGWAVQHGVEVVEQRPECLRTGLTWAGLDVPKGHPPNWLSAFGHGFYYLHKNKLAGKARVLQERRPLGARIIEDESRE